jgi:hypothetical protein
MFCGAAHPAERCAKTGVAKIGAQTNGKKRYFKSGVFIVKSAPV